MDHQLASQSQLTAVIGLGEIGKPLAEMLAHRHVVHGVDLAPVTIDAPVDVMHVCIPFQLPDFIGVVARYAELYRPGLIVVNSTVVPGTSRAIAARVPSLVAYSPVRGKHVKMTADMALYRKFVAGVTPQATERAVAHFAAVGIRTDAMPTADTLELAKLTETSYFGVLIAWAQQVNRFAEQLGVDYDQVVRFYDEIKFFPPVKYTPGFIGGHCVIPNIQLLKRQFESPLLDAVLESNDRRAVELDLAKPST